MQTITVYPADYTEAELYAMYASIAEAFPEHDAEDVREAADFACVSPEGWNNNKAECMTAIAAHL